MARSLKWAKDRLSVNINDLPDNIILEVFTHLNVKELCVITRVCKSWKRIASDRSLWKTVDLRPYKFDLRNLGKLARNRFSDVLISLRLRGSLQKATTRSWSKDSVSDALLRDLRDRCPNLKELEIGYVNASNISVESFPPTIRSLVLSHSFVPCGWFKILTKNADVLPNLTTFDLTESRKLTDCDLLSICRSKRRITTLKLNGCYRITGSGLKRIADLDEMVVLEISGTACDDLALHHVCRANKKLETLNLSFCKLISDGGMDSVATLPRLRSLDLEGCVKITNAGLGPLASCRNLRELNVESTSVNDIAAIGLAASHCKISL